MNIKKLLEIFAYTAISVALILTLYKIVQDRRELDRQEDAAVGRLMETMRSINQQIDSITIKSRRIDSISRIILSKNKR